MRVSVSPTDRVVLRSMFREILRGLRKIRDQAPILASEDSASKEYTNEAKKASINGSQYREYLLSEIRHTAFQKFSSEPKYTKDHVRHSQLWQGHDLVEKLAAIHAKSTSETWKELVEIVIAERTSQLRKSQWKLDDQAHKKAIDEGHLKEMQPLQAKRFLSRQKQEKPKIDITTDKGYKLRLAESKDNAEWVVRNYLKKLQLGGRIPNPYKLPYVSANMHQQALHLPKADSLLPGSTKAAVMESAYNMDYVENIIKPEIEYVLNKRHFLDAYQNIVNNKGPVKVSVRSTSAGIMQAHFIRSPVKDEVRLKRLAIDVKKSTRVIRKQFIWKLSSAQAENLSERKVGDGYAVRGSKGFSVDEIMYPRRYYEEIVSREAEWEYMMKLEELKATHGQLALEKVSAQLGKVRSSILHGWMAPLDTASKEVDDEVESYFRKYKITDDSPIWSRRHVLQLRMNKNYERTSRKLANLVTLLKNDKVCAHSDLFHRSGHSGSKSGQMPEKGRAVAGKSLGDYLEQVGLKGYKMGYEFKKRLNIG